MRLPEGDRLSKRYIEFTSDLAVAMGGRVAEELISRENVSILMGTFPSNVGLAVSNLAAQLFDLAGHDFFLGKKVFLDKAFLGMRLVARDDPAAASRLRRQWNALSEPARAIVLHPAWYANPDMLEKWGKLGRSDGCFAMAEADFNEALWHLSGGRLLYADRLGIY